jgi:5-methylcytosine-specific restriction endonuclease McrA
VSFQAMAWAGEKIPRRNGKLSSRSVAAVWAKYGVTLACVYCERGLVLEGTYNPNGLTSGFTVDHVLPKCRGGKDRWDNFVPACYQCNAQKRERTADEYRAWLEQKNINPKKQWVRS